MSRVGVEGPGPLAQLQNKTKTSQGNKSISFLSTEKSFNKTE